MTKEQVESELKIARNHVAVFSYVLKDDSGNELERSTEEAPTAYLHGHYNILYALETALEGASIGEHRIVALTAAEAYGLRQDDAVIRIANKNIQIIGDHARKRFNQIKTAKKIQLKKGMIVQFKTEQGLAEGTVVNAGKFTSDIDSNHPMAGMNLVFEIVIRDVRAATPEELLHGHAHGIGGHQH